MSKESFEQFQQHVLQTPALQESLSTTQDDTERLSNLEVFLNQAVLLGEQNGYSFTAQEVKAAIKAENQNSSRPLSEETIDRLTGEVIMEKLRGEGHQYI